MTDRGPTTSAALGKLAPRSLERLLAQGLGARREDVVLGPAPGRDSAIVRVGAGRVLAVTTDPLSIVPALGVTESATLACRLVASDLWTSGIPPAYASVTLNLPPTFSDSDLDAYASAMSAEWERLGVAVVAGHTGRYDGCDLSIVGAATLFGLGDEGRWVGAPFVQPGDRVLMTKDCAVEATAIAARMFPKRLAQRLDDEQIGRARSRLEQVSVVAECRAAVRVGVRDRGVSAMHDATEGGLVGGLVEMARATGHDVRVAAESVLLSPEAAAACATFGIDPLWTLSEGTLIVTVRPRWALEVMNAIAEEGIAVQEIGEVMRGSGAVWLTAQDGKVEKIVEPRPDPYWDAYARALREGWT